MNSTSEKQQFDAALGGCVEVPSGVRIQQLVKARINEIEALTQLIETPSSNIMYKQKFPKHLRRRAMSHNVKRLPARLREEHMEKREKSGIREVPMKRPRRKYRRRPSNLLNDYNRRQKTHVWLESHIWHAKRFKMIEKWGYKLPHHPNDKSFRACYRASTKHCLIQDISYYSCLELSGTMSDIVDGLNRHCSSDCGLTFGSSHIESGCYEGSVFFYQSDKYPQGAIGEIRYFCQPVHKDSRRTIWLWCHPAIYNEVVEELIKTFSFELKEEMQVNEDLQERTKGSNVERTKLLCRNVPFVKCPKYRSRSSVQMMLLKDTLNRFRLIGPLSQALLSEAFRPADLSQRTVEDWTFKYCKGEGLNCFNSQLEFWQKIKKMSSPGQFPRHLILSIIVIDPRFNLPSGRKKAEGNIEGLGEQSLLNTKRELPLSAIWSSEVRDEVALKKLSTQQINEMRSNKLVPGYEIESKETNFNNLPVIPMLLIQNPGEDNDITPLGYGSGWDIIVPCGYGMPVWLALNLHGGRAGGLKEHANICREQGKIMFPPDTPAGNSHEASLEKEDTEKYFALPPDKRENYIKLGTPFPFRCPWEIMVKDWTGNKMFYVLRDREKLILLQKKLKNVNQQVTFSERDLQSLVPLFVKLRGKGTLARNSHICVPNLEDFQKLNEEPCYSGPIEPEHSDLNERKKVRLEHKSLLKRLSRKRKKVKENSELLASLKSEGAVAEQKEVMRRLWLPSCESVKDYCSRTIFGFVREADFSFTKAQTVGLGYVSLKGFLKFLELESGKHSNVALVRNINTNQYRFAQISVVF